VRLYLSTVLRCARPRRPLGSILSALVRGTSPNSLRDLWRTSGQATGFCPPLTAYVRLWLPAAGQASSALGGVGALLSAVGQGEVLLEIPPGCVALAGPLGHFYWAVLSVYDRLTLPNATSGSLTGFPRKIRGFLTWPGSIWQCEAGTENVSKGGSVILRMPTIASRIENDMRCATGTPATGAHIKAHINAHIIFPRTSVPSEMARTPFCQLRTLFWAGAHTILPGGANHFLTRSIRAEPDGHSARQASTRLAKVVGWPPVT